MCGVKARRAQKVSHTSRKRREPASAMNRSLAKSESEAVSPSALPAGTKVERLKMSDFWENEPYQQEIMEDCVMTDDPLGSGAAIAHLKTGRKVWSLAFLGAEWEMIVVEIDGQCYWGFVPTNCMSHG